VDERTLLKLYGAIDMMLLPYLNMQQISSGILADTLGSGRVAIATKFRYALELIHSNGHCPSGVVIWINGGEGRETLSSYPRLSRDGPADPHIR
jgi:hypothetical protein